MGYLRVLFLGFSLFSLTCGLCWMTGILLQFNPLFSIAFFLLGTLGVVLAIDMVIAFFLQ